MSLVTKEDRRLKRRRRVRAKVSGTAERPRVSVRRTNRGIFAQLIDDIAGQFKLMLWSEANKLLCLLLYNRPGKTKNSQISASVIRA